MQYIPPISPYIYQKIDTSETSFIIRILYYLVNGLLNLIAQTFLTISLEPPLRSAFLSVNIQFIDQHHSAGIAGCRNRINVVTHPLIALYFACKGNKPTYQNHAGDIGGKDGCVWMLYLGNYRHYLTILRCFYKEIIVEKYKYRIVDDSRDQYLGDHEIGTIHLGDARHLAMINAMQSGATPVVAMLLAGHSNMAMGAHYYTNLTRMIECRTHREYRKYLNGDASYNLIPAAGALPLPTESCPLQDGGRCYSQAYQEGRIDDCKEVLGPRGEIGYCPQCRYYRCDHDSFWGADDHYKREIQSDLKLLRDSAQLVREGKGYQEDIYEALLKLQASTLSYQAFLIDKMKNNH